MSIQGLIASIAFSVLLFNGAAMAGEPLTLESCTKDGKPVTDENRRFSTFQDGVADTPEFSDIECGVLWRAQQCTAIQFTFDGNAVVFDHATGEKLQMSSAFFVLESGVTTPMGSGIIAFKDKASAEKFVLEQGKGKAVDYIDLLAR